MFHGGSWFISMRSGDEKPKVTRELLLRVLSYAREYWWHIAGMLVTILLTTGLSLLTPLIFRNMIDVVIPAKDINGLVLLSLGLLLIPALKGSFLEKDVIIPIDDRGRAFIPFAAGWDEGFLNMGADTLLKRMQDETLRGNLTDFFEGRLVLIGDIVGVPVGDLFMGAVLPGMVLVVLYVLYILVAALLKPKCGLAVATSTSVASFITLKGGRSSRSASRSRKR